MRVATEAVLPQFISVIRRPMEKMATIDEEENEVFLHFVGHENEALFNPCRLPLVEETVVVICICTLVLLYSAVYLLYGLSYAVLYDASFQEYRDQKLSGVSGISRFLQKAGTWTGALPSVEALCIGGQKSHLCSVTVCI
ncbi:hypothetical protein POM88_017375 [Heracleum sosnowskyi]|uniref:Uncharacterized protein n=1 Tax=Heracleum sosnowskyi TaxID=360622 RepID=A0AAD8INK5_9APIA|nr:hypothetical protein POM88_017375 [Heracleum sosnowskyi]